MFERVFHKSMTARPWSRYLQSVKCARLLPHALACLLVVAPLAAAQELQLAPPTGSDPEGIETLTQGPIHEAFANPSDLDPTPGPLVMRQPPPDIQEEPPEFMPEDSTWISGYWIWDDERDDFIWITGVARKPPPGMRYLAGYWTETDGGWQRVSGFWTSADAPEVEYRPQPPDSLEVGPSSPAPADNYFWVPGCWTYYDTGYRWRAGYWSPYQPDWVWCPARWVWTPGGFVYLPGFWDFRLSFRGQIFAPIVFRQPIYQRPAFVYRPWCVIPTNNLFIHLWIRPTYSHYYFGNYYGPQYANFGFQSWCHIGPQRRYYDPFFSYCSVHYRRQGVDYLGRVQGWHDYYHQHEDLRPARTWQEQQVAIRAGGRREALETQLVARNVVEVAQRNDAPVKLTRLDNETRQAMIEKTVKVRELNTSRKKVERDAAQVVARLPRNIDNSRGADRGPEVDRGAKGAKGLPDVASARTGVKPPKLTLPKENLTGAVVKSDDQDAPRGKGRPNIAGETRGAERAGASRRDTIPPPMPQAEGAADATPPVERGKGKSSDRGPERSGKVEDSGKSRPAAPRINPLPDTPPADVTPPVPDRGDDADRGKTGKGKGSKGSPDKGKLPKVETPRIEVPPVDPRPRVNPLPGAVPGDVTPPARDPGDDADRGKTAKGKGSKGSPDKGKLPKVETPRIEAPPEDPRPRVNPLPGAVPGDVTPPAPDRGDDADRGKTGKSKAPQGNPNKGKLPKVETPATESPPADAAPRGKARVEPRRPDVPPLDKSPAPRIELPQPLPREIPPPRPSEVPRENVEKTDTPPGLEVSPRVAPTPPSKARPPKASDRPSKSRGKDKPRDDDR